MTASPSVERKRNLKRQAIFDAAARRFAEHGYHATRMQDIAEDMGLQKPALYHYFGSKEAILVELIRSRVGVALEDVSVISRGAGPPAAKVEEAVRTHLRVFHEHADLYTIFNSEKLRTISAEAASIVDELGRRYEIEWGAMIGAGVRGGEFAPGLDIGITVKAILGMLNTTLTWFDPNGRLSLDQLSDRFASLVEATLTPR
ncbi:TetR/AcrR family transcriptional regulator [soil metagenome]